MACHKIRWSRSGRVDTSNASPRNAPPVIHKTCRPMPSSEPGKPYLAFDFGAESGRAVLAHLHSGVLTTEEVHHFPNSKKLNWQASASTHGASITPCWVNEANSCRILITIGIAEPME